MRVLLLVWFLIFSLLGFSQNKNRALIIGVSEYKELPKASQLQYADNDALEFYRFIRSKAAGNVDSADVKLLLNENATAAQIWRALDELVDVSQANDKIIIYFSGHGDIETKTVKQRGFLLAHDSPRAGYQVGGTIKISELQDYLETLVTVNKARVILITDACRSGKLAGGEAGASQTTAALNEHWGSITKILSSQAGELSAESDAWGKGHGIFTYNLVRGLWGLADHDGDGWVSLTELNIYLSQEVPKATYDAQHPVVSGNLSSKISKVDSKRVAALKAMVDVSNGDGDGDGDGDGVLLASAKGSFNLDALSKKLYDKFTKALKRKNLVGSGASAFSYYRRLFLINERNQAFMNELRRLLVAGLEDDVQGVINRYMSQDKSLDDYDYGKARMELDSILTLVSKADSRYNNLNTKRLFFDADLLGCTCDPSEVNDADARTSVRKLRIALTTNPEMPYLHNSIGSAYFFLDKYDSAMVHYRKAIELAPAWVYPINNLGTIFFEKEKYDSAIALFKRSIEKAPDDPWAFMQITRSLTLQEKFAEAVHYAREHFKIEGTAYSSFLIGMVYDAKSDYDSAILHYKSALALDPTHFQSLDALSEIYITLEKYDEAKRYGQILIDSYPEKSTGFLVMASADYNQGFFTDAQINYKKAWILNPNDASTALDLGDAFRELKNYDSAVVYYQKSIALDPTQDMAHNNIGMILHFNKKYKEALPYYLKAFSIDSTTADYANNLGLIYFDLKRFDNAIVFLNKALKLDSKLPVVHGNLSDYYKKMKNKKLAAYHRAVYLYLENEGPSNEMWTELKKCLNADFPVKSDPFLVDLLGDELKTFDFESYKPKK